MTDDRVGGIERAIFGDVREAAVDDWLDRFVRSQLSSGLQRVRFRSGRISAVFGVELADDRAVVVKVHRGRPDLGPLTAAVDGQRWLVDHGYPAPVPLAGPAVLDGHTAVVESLLDTGSRADAHDPAVREALVGSLVEQVRLLAGVRDQLAGLTVRPAWAVWDGGPWPVPHDPIFDFTTTPSGWEWLDDFARRAAAVLVATELPPSLGHLDWCAGNVLITGGGGAPAAVTAAFDWDSLAAGSEAGIAGVSAGGFVSGSTAGANSPTPAEMAAFFADHDRHRGTPFSGPERAVAVHAAAWVLAYNARCGLCFLEPDGSPPAWSPAALLADHRQDYLDIEW